MYYPACGTMHIKDTLLLIGKSNQSSGSSRFSLLLFEWSCLMSYNRNLKCVESVAK